MQKLLLVSIIVAACQGTAAAQFPAGLSGSVTPSAGATGTVFNVVVTARGGPVDVNGCVVKDVRAGSPAGPSVFSPFCIAVIQTINPCQTLSGSWDGTDDFGAPVPPGDYFIRTATFQGDFFWPVRVDGGGTRPTLTANSAALLGQPLLLSISDPTDPGAFYIAAAAFTTNVGVSVSPTEFLALDVSDPLFALTFPVPDPALFANLQGTLDINGDASGIGMFIPPVPALSCLGMAWQAAVIGGNGLRMTNTIHFTIL